MRIERLGRPGPQDRDALATLWEKAWHAAMPALDFAARRPWFEAELDRLAAAGALLLVHRDAQATIVSLLTLQPATGMLDQLAVDPGVGGRGLGRALLAEAKRLSPSGLRLTVNAQNPRALALYTAAGFVATGHGINPRSGLPTIDMAWRPPETALQSEAASCPAIPGVGQRGPDPRSTMMDLTLSTAQTMLAATLSAAREKSLKPLVVVVLDARGVVKAAAAEDGTSLRRFDIAHGKAYGALSLGIGSRSIGKRAVDQAYFVAAVSHVVGGNLVPVPGGVLVRDAGGALLGAVGASGDTSDNDEIAILAGIAAAGLKAEPGTD